MSENDTSTEDTLPLQRRSRSEPAEAVKLQCTVLIDGTTIGKLQVAAGHRCSLPAAKAKALAGLNPPAVHIDGI